MSEKELFSVTDVKKIVDNAVANARVENKMISDETIKMIEKCLKTKNGSLLFQLYLNTKGVILEEDTVVEEAKNSIYCYENGVLKNKYNTKNLELLHILEADSAAYHQSKILGGETDYRFNFTVDSYLDLHKRLFSEVYDFAGEIRSEAINKSCKPYFDKRTPFCEPIYIYESLKSTLNKMLRDLRRVQNREDLLYCLAKYYCEINVIHPFREGNGRTLRTYFLILVKELFRDYELDYSLWNDEDRELLLKYVIIDSSTVDIEEVGVRGIASCFDKVLVSKEKKKISR